MVENTMWVRGVSFRPDQVGKIDSGDEVLFKPEPDNEYDPNAVKVLVIQGSNLIHVGYVPKELTQYIRPLAKEMEEFRKNPWKSKGGYWNSRITEIVYEPDEENFGVQIAFESDVFIPDQEKLKSDE